jgi:predicted acyltransferase
MAEPNSSVVTRVASVDAYRGLVMFLLMAENLQLARVAKALPDSAVWKFLAHHQEHVEWAGCTLHDLIQPSFSFLVGTSLAFSLANRATRGQRTGWIIFHAVWRALVLILLGIFFRSMGRKQTNFTFEDTLTQIGLGYLPLVLISFMPRKGWWVALGVILVGYWAAFALYPLPGPNFDYQAAGADPNWSLNYSGFAAHWNKNTNLAWAFDRWFLNLFPRESPFRFNGGGYATLSFIPTLGTMLLGLFAGDWIKRFGPTRTTLVHLTVAGCIFLTTGLLLDIAGVCPSVKRIWTPSWTLVSGGACFLILMAFYAVCDVVSWRAWSYPLRVIGMNSIAAYTLAHCNRDFIAQSLQTHFGRNVVGRVWPDYAGNIFKFFGPEYEPFVRGVAILVVFWLILWWMARRKILIRI